MSDLSAGQELDNWLHAFKSLKTAEEKNVFRQNLLSTLDAKSDAEHAANLKALKEAVRQTRQKAEAMLMPADQASFQVFPNSEEERTFLQTLLERLNIAYRVAPGPAK